MKESWESRIERAEHLAAQMSGAGDLLSFYAKLLRTQQQVHEELSRRLGWLPSGALEQDLPALRALLPGLLRMVESCGTAALSTEAQHLLQADEAELDALLLDYWRAPSDLQFFAKAFLQPYARWLAEIGERPKDRNLAGGKNQCPFCAGMPQLSFLQNTEPGSAGGSRHLLCAMCLMAWPFHRVVCAHCGEERPAKLAYFQTPEYDHVRIEACDNCNHYIKGIDLTRLGLAVPLVDEVAAAPLDLWAREHGYTKIELNLVGL
jgi:formate dehydrogenase accessory protein FdhE